MNKFSKTLAAVAITSIISGCSYKALTQVEQQGSATKVQVQVDPMVAQILAADIDVLWSQDFNHYQAGLLKAVADAISSEALKGDLANEKLEKLSFYLRIYSSFGADKNWSDKTAASVNNALSNLRNMPGFFQVNETTARLHENYAVALYRLYFLAPLQPYTAQQVKPLSQLINLYAKANLTSNDTDTSKAIDYALWANSKSGGNFTL